MIRFGEWKILDQLSVNLQKVKLLFVSVLLFFFFFIMNTYFLLSSYFERSWGRVGEFLFSSGKILLFVQLMEEQSNSEAK